MNKKTFKKPIAHGLLIGSIVCMSFSMTGCSSSSNSNDANTTSTAATSENSSSSAITIENMIEAGKTENLLSGHDSVMLTATYHIDDDALTQYADEELISCELSNINYAELYNSDGELVYNLSEGIYAGAMYIDTEPEDYSFGDYFTYGNQTNEETITSSEESDGNLYVTTELSEDTTESIFDTDGYTYTKGDTMQIEYILDAETLAPISYEEILISADGTESSYMSAEITYDVERPDTASTMYEHANETEDLRTVTVIVDPDTENEETYTKQVPKGDAVALYASEDCEGAYTDRDCTEELTSLDKQEDATLYYKSAS